MYPNWLQANCIGSDALKDKYLKISFSQDGEDDFVRSFFWDQILNGYKGTYIDIGCYNESLYSNTKLLSLIGWKGFALDANPDTKELWMRKRPHDIFIQAAIKPSGCGEKTVDLYRFADGALNTIDLKTAKSLQQRGTAVIDIISIPSIGLEELSLKIKQNFAQAPDFVNIDIEFVDYLDELSEFLRILGKPKLLCIEMISPKVSIDNFKQSREYMILKGSGYKVISLIGKNMLATPEGQLSNKVVSF